MSVNKGHEERRHHTSVRRLVSRWMFGPTVHLAIAIGLVVGGPAGADIPGHGAAKHSKKVAREAPGTEVPPTAAIAGAVYSVWNALSTPPAQCLDMHNFVGGEGLRSLYCTLRGVFGVAELEALAGLPAFLAGPHDDGDLRLHANRFGAYNPSMVRWVETNLLPDASDTDFIARTQWIYDRSIRQMARAYHRSYVQLSHNLQHFDQERRYLMDMINGDRPWAYMGARFQVDTLRAVLDLDIQAEDLNWYHVDTAIRYWQRRSIDGSADEVFQALETLLSLYDPDFLVFAPRPAGTAPHLPPFGAGIAQPVDPGKPWLPEPRR